MNGHVAVVLAAGRSTRLGQSKQALRFDGRSLETRACELAAATAPRELLLVRAHDDSRPLPTLPLRRVDAPAGGMGCSLRAAVAASPPDAAGWLVLLVDQPALSAEHLQALLARWLAEPARPVASTYAGTVGVPAILPGGWRERLLSLDADQGARSWLRSAPGLAVVSDEALAADIDEPGDLS